MEIKVLSSDVVDQIAAGEVVERPSHLLKELMENSLDAGATQIEVDVDAGGKKIKVSDNGKGIHREDLSLVCARHATSKIADADDLWKLHTFGFRGEALASISSVSRLKITSKRKDSDLAYSLENEFGKTGETLPSGRDVGTTVEMEELFANVPARLKFLKSDAAEITQIKLVVKALALAHPQVEFKFKQQGKVVLFYSKDSGLLSRAMKVLEVKDVFCCQREYQGMKLEAIYGSPQTTTGNSKQIWIFVQNRWVSDRTIQAAIMESYRSLLMHGEFPFVVLKIEVPEGSVDVNIHPTKSQVKFVDQSSIFRFVHGALRSELENAPWIETLNQREGSGVPQRPLFTNTPENQEPQNMTFSGFVPNSNFDRTQYQQKDFTIQALRAASVRDSQNGLLEVEQFKGAQVHFSNENNTREPELCFWSQLQVIGQSHLTYIVAEAANSFFLIDQHAAHERVVFERLMEHWKQGIFDVQNYLIPLSLSLSSEAVDLMCTLQEEFRRMGVDLEKAGPETLLLSSSPSFISESALSKALHQFADEVTNLGGSFSFEKKIADVFATMACHSVVRAGQALSFDEMKQLLVQMDEYRLSSYCPHGRNVYVEIPFTKIEKDFGRIP